MTQITINLPDQDEAKWLLDLLNRLQVSYQVSNNSEQYERARAVIMRGANSLDVDKMLESIEDSRKGRKHPFREV
ncbi:hypothetical protein [Arsenicibacter rosenii]|uniref:Uncharacterized protein n=1 Tax=Arsenicibacter rosenii TaxID=1750698 RepID=A0A1S2VG28_9BACT|nr:hypothetical protein [Arsenicibacter rosenii]OIN57672.1 hypothetical protein BLX24_18140 [Arsenicibacter rosenii]